MAEKKQGQEENIMYQTVSVYTCKIPSVIFQCGKEQRERLCVLWQVVMVSGIFFSI